ncbi:phosphoethanolamine transferase EptA [Kosakonia cowanii]|uniref:phosphoethanolamine transferase EptA n=1 Tax=Kosakonia cowanii TaxID=208223 RepID=UPI0027313714|nr:phosphoethanolamine transferase EptA [Kosakonia cowanii]WKW41161.1 phosphoethanolamine transferase EptA [Kosakonia cowanii]
MRTLSLYRPSLSRLSLLTLAALYIALVLNIVFYRQAFHLLPVDSLHNALVFLTMPLVAFSVINIVLTLASFLCLDRLLLSLFILLCAAAQYFISTFGVIIDRSMITNILDTTAAESFALMSGKMVMTLVLTALLPVIIAWWIKIKPTRPLLRSITLRLLSVAISALIIIAVAVPFYKDYASLFRNNKELVKSLGPSNAIAASLSWYVHNRMDNLPLVRIGEDAHQLPQMKRGPRKNLTILVLGETSRGDDFSLGGYDRETNPLLKQDNVIYFPNTTSCGTATAVSVPCMFSGMGRAHYDDQLAHHQEGLLDVVQRAGIQVLWNENDGGCKGACDRVPHQDMTQLNLADYCIKGECQDEILFRDLARYIDQLPGDGLIVLHTIGSHGPTYYNRYPAQMRKFTPTCDTNEIQACSREQLVNTYDNTIVYVDYIVDKAIKLLQSKQDRFTTSLVYLSDHGESLGENGVYLHGLPYSIAPATQKHVPLLIWLSPDYQTRYGINNQCVAKNAREKAYSQDNLFPTMLGILGVSTTVYHPEDDILTPCREQVK